MHELLDSSPTLPTQGKWTLPEKADVMREKYKLENYTWYANKGEEGKVTYTSLFLYIVLFPTFCFISTSIVGSRENKSWILWDSSIEDTFGIQLAVLYKEVP